MTGISFSRLFGAAFVAALILGRAASAAPADNCAAAASPAVQAADTDASGLISEPELAAARDKWQAGALARDDMDAITKAWIYQCPIESAKGKAPTSPAEAGTLPGGQGPPKHVDVPGMDIKPNIFNDINGDNKFTLDDCALLHKDLANKGVALTDLQYDFTGNGSVSPEDVKACEEFVDQMSATSPASGEPANPAEAGLTLSLERATSAGGEVRALTTEPAEAGLACALDWGDGTRPVAVTPQTTRHETRHVYKATGNYTVAYKCRRPNGDTLTRTAGISVDVTGPSPAAAGHNLTVLFVPFNYPNPAAAAADVSRAADWIKQATPLTEFTDASVSAVIAPAGQCAPGPDHRACDDAVMNAWGASADKGGIDLAVGMCAPGTCLLFLQQSPGRCEVSSGITYGLGRRLSIVDMFSCQGADSNQRIDGQRTLIHELGHAWGLDHVRACGLPESATVCLADPGSANCKQLTATFDDGVNAGDANAPGKERDYMTYCPTAVDHYGPAGLAHIRQVLFTSGLPRSLYTPSP